MSTKYKNEELLAELCECFRRSNITLDETAGELYDVYTEGLFEKLQYVPEENLKKLISTTEKKGWSSMSVSDWLEHVQNEGLLRFDPYWLPEEQSYVLAYNAYFHMFRRDGFQISYTARGIGERDHTCFRLKGILRQMSQFSTCCDDSDIEWEGARDFVSLLLYAEFIELAYNNDKFRRWLQEDENRITEAVRNVLGREYCMELESWPEIKRKYITQENICLPDESIDVSIDYIKGSESWGCDMMMWYNVSERTICVVSSDGDLPYNATVLHVPDDEWFDELWFFDHVNDIPALLISMVMRLRNYKINWQVAYRLQATVGPMKIPNDRRCKAINNLNDLSVYHGGVR